MAERLDGWTCNLENPGPVLTASWISFGSEPKFKSTIKQVNRQLVYIRSVGLIINLVIFI